MWYFHRTMGKHLKNILDGMRQALVLVPAPRDYVRPQRGEFARDAQRLNGDFAAIGQDMRTVLKRDEPSHYRAR